MSHVCSSELQKEDFVNFSKEKPSFKDCNVKVNYPCTQTMEDSWMIKKSELILGDQKKDNCFSKRKQKFQCHCVDRTKRAEIKRRHFIKKLKYIYKIDVEDVTEPVLNEIIMKVKLLEKEKREKRQRYIDRMTTMIGRLLKDQNSKIRESKVQNSKSKILKGFQFTERICFEKEKLKEKESHVKKVWKNYPENQTVQEKDLYSVFTLNDDEKNENLPKEEGVKEKRALTRLENVKQRKRTATKMLVRKGMPCVSFEQRLESTPKCVEFKDYKKNHAYLQEVKITNVGVETIHCRYLGILVHVKGEGKFPIGVAVRDNIKLRPGLSCSTKIRLCSPDDSSEMKCSIVYETRRQKKSREYSWFFVPVSCLPARAIVKVTPLRIIFPTLNWCEATDPENANQLTKVLKIENTGGKGCVCKISDKSRKPVSCGDLGEYGGEGASVQLFSPICQSEISKEDDASLRKEFYGEDYFPSYEEPEKRDETEETEETEESAKTAETEETAETAETSETLDNELIENDFATFQFSKKYCIEIPPFAVQNIEVKFVPKYKGFHHEMKYVQFEGCYNLEEQSIELLGNIKRIPIGAIPNLIDFKTCVINSGVYEEIFQVYNCSRAPFHIRIKIPPSLKKHAHVYPRTTILQSRSWSVFSVKIYPRVTLSKDAPRYYDENSGILEFPVRVHPAKVRDCSKDYVEVYVHALITTYDLELSPAVINFGTVSAVETIRTKIELTNHSLAVQEFAFLNLPKGVRVEPNMGFGTILPKETIPLFLLFSPVADLCREDNGKQEVEFDVTVTSIANFGGFREKLKEETNEEQPEWKVDEYEYKPLESIEEFSSVNIDESQSNEGRKVLGPEEERVEEKEKEEEEEEEEEREEKAEEEGEEEENEQKEGESSDSDFCEDSSVAGEELTSKVRQHENKIRNFLRSEDDTMTKVNFQSEDDKKDILATMSIIGEHEEEESFQKTSRSDLNVLKCRATIVIPRCQLSETVIQLPATPFKCFSLYRFYLIGISDNFDLNCKCGLRNVAKGNDIRGSFSSTFEFLYSDPQIKLEPGSGYLKAGESVPVTIILRPEVDESLQESSISNASDSIRKKLSKKNSIVSKSTTGLKNSSQTKKHETSKGPRGTDDADMSEMKVPSLSQTKKSDSYESTSAPEMPEPFSFETKVRCVIKTLSCAGDIEMTEIHDMILICPAIRRDFNYLGRTEEINFGKVPIGTRSQIILHFQNISSERLSPFFTLLNPAGPFICPGNFNKVDIDPEHIWRQPLTFAPNQNKIDSQFFEVNLGHTCMLLNVIGEALEPRYEVLPCFGCCLLESKPGAVEEIKLEIINHSPVELFLQMEKAYTREGVDLQTDVEKEEVKDKKKKYRFWDTTPEVIINSVKDFEESKVNVFTLVGVDAGNNFVVPPNEANQIKIQFWAPPENNDKKYAMKYNLTLGKRLLLKEIIVLGSLK